MALGGLARNPSPMASMRTAGVRKHRAGAQLAGSGEWNSHPESLVLRTRG